MLKILFSFYLLIHGCTHVQRRERRKSNWFTLWTSLLIVCYKGNISLVGNGSNQFSCFISKYPATRRHTCTCRIVCGITSILRIHANWSPQWIKCNLLCHSVHASTPITSPTPRAKIIFHPWNDITKQFHLMCTFIIWCLFLLWS